MPFYDQIDERTLEGKRTLEGLERLRRQLDDPDEGSGTVKIPPRNLNDTLLLATWNIREFDSTTYGRRSDEAIQYIAEIISRFDIIAIQEVRGDLEGMERLCSRLGSWWDYIVSDVTEGRAGNDERMAFLYDTRKVHFGRMAGELVLPPLKDGDTTQPVKQVARTPFMCRFSCGWSNFILSAVHILYGSGRTAEADRAAEIDGVANFINKRSSNPATLDKNFVLLGDFNIFQPSDQAMQALLNNGFTIPSQLQSLPSNAGKNKYYDQIAFSANGDLEFTGKAGVFDYFASVYRAEDEALYQKEMGNAYRETSPGKPRKNKPLYYLNYWRTHQMSDHLPMWVELKVNLSSNFLAEKLRRAMLG
ncbi:MAG: endonuclease/exonuclease/phosphatase family protein [Gammaproteobacteria bacterium]|nr:endonuclease/exonuclease/phosphatase family protein [Gammaproteobacteria bacterium]MBU1724525.1 endonuclease/exonuclease/phosphatase family protein [Gammaproteobacteria bacterium]MBU2004568.1 endonuclease/exonuclease/phosphatase family protein [Gammaproteobacteria bacterium]